MCLLSRFSNSSSTCSIDNNGWILSSSSSSLAPSCQNASLVSWSLLSVLPVMPNELDNDDDETNSAVAARINTAVSNSNDGRRLFDIIILIVAEIDVVGGALSTVTSRLLA